jgi:Pvc16 N-terminal domain
MSNALAIAAVSAVLKDLLNNGIINHDLASAVGAVNVSARAPDLVPTGGNDPAQLILFLYRVSYNQGWCNNALPSRDDRGERVSNPPLALDLHYLLIAHGAQEFQAEILLGYAMQLLHENPVLSRDAIRRALAPPAPVSGGVLPPAFQALAAADLADQFESIRITPDILGVEELAKIWPTFHTGYRVTTGYQVSVVLIESQKSTRAALPVRKPKLYVLPFARPTIASASADVPPGSDMRITVASTLVLSGSDLRGPITRVRVGEGLAPPPALTISDTRISLPLAGVAGLRAGATGAQVVHDIPMGEPEVAHRGTESNVVAFVLHPTISGTPIVNAGSSTVENGVTFFSPTITTTINPRVGRKQRVLLLLNEFNPPDTRPARAYSFPAPQDNGIADPDQPDTNSIAFAGRHVAAGTYLVRVLVDGAESLLTTNGSGSYDQPQVTLA